MKNYNLLMKDVKKFGYQFHYTKIIFLYGIVMLMMYRKSHISKFWHYIICYLNILFNKYYMFNDFFIKIELLTSVSAKNWWMIYWYIVDNKIAIKCNNRKLFSIFLRFYKFNLDYSFLKFIRILIIIYKFN